MESSQQRRVHRRHYGLRPEGATAKRIPLWTQNGESPCFSQSDVILEDGDVVYLRARQKDVFFTGGLISGAEIPLPRDYDVDILEAVSIANASVGGPGGQGGQVFRAGAGPGNIIPPTRAIVLRKVGNGQQVAIRVDLERAVRDPKQRITIQPGDFIMLYYKPGETFFNAAINFVNFNFLIGSANKTVRSSRSSLNDPLQNRGSFFYRLESEIRLAIATSS